MAVSEQEIASLYWALTPKASPRALASFVVASFDRNSHAVALGLALGEFPTPEIHDLLMALRRAAIAVAYSEIQPELVQLNALLETPGQDLINLLHRVTVSICKHWRYIPGTPLAKILFWCQPRQVEIVRSLLVTKLDRCGALCCNSGKIQEACLAVKNWSSRQALEQLLYHKKPPFYPPSFCSWGEVAMEVVYIVESALEANSIFSTQHFPCAWWDDRFDEYKSLHVQILAAVERALRAEHPQLRFEEWFSDRRHENHAYTKNFVLTVARAVMEPNLRFEPLDFSLTDYWTWLMKAVVEFEEKYPGARHSV